MVGWHHRLKGHEFEQAPGAGEGQGGLACCSPWGCKEPDTTDNDHNTIINPFGKAFHILGYAFNIIFNICICCKVTSTVSLLNIHNFFLVMRTFKIYSQQLMHM